MAVLLVLPGFASPEGVFLFEIRVALDGFPLLPWEFEVDVLELIVETSLAGVRKTRAEIHAVDAPSKLHSCTSGRERRSRRDRSL